MIEISKAVTRYLGLGLIILFCITINSYAYNIKVEVENAANQRFYLASYKGPDFFIIDSLISNQNGIVKFTGEEPLPWGVYFIVIAPHTRFDFLLAEEQDIIIKSNTRNILGDLTISGDSQYQLFADLQKEIAELNKQKVHLNMQKQFFKSVQNDTVVHIKSQIDSLNKIQINLYGKYQKKTNADSFLFKILNLLRPFDVPEEIERLRYSNPKAHYEYYKAHFLDRVDFSEPYLLNTPDFVFHRLFEHYCYYFFDTRANRLDEIFQDVDNLINKSKINEEFNQYIVSYLISRYQNHNDKRLEAVLVYIFDRYLYSDRPNWIDDKAFEMIEFHVNSIRYNLIGNVAQNIELNDLNGKLHSLYDLESDYKLVWFWEPDCEICVKSTLELREHYSDLRFIGVEIFAVNTGDDIELMQKIINENRLGWINVIDSDPLSDIKDFYGIYKTPQLFLLNRKNEIIAKQIRPSRVFEFISERRGW